MILWHVGATLAIVRYVFKDPNMDLRFLAVGSLLPDLIDKPIGSVLFVETFQTARVYGHALVFPVALLVAVMLLTRRGTLRRKALLGLPIGALLHLFLDGQWANPEGFWWPFLGLDFPEMDPARFWPLLKDTVTDPLILAGEAIGLAYLVALARKADAAEVAATGRVPMEGKPVTPRC